MSLDTKQKLELLSDASKYDLACACGTNDSDRRTRGADGKWLYPVTLPNGGTSILLKTLLSSTCSNDCRYCPLRSNMDVPRCTLGAEEIANVFMDYVRRRDVFGMFLSSGVIGTPDNTMQRLAAVASILRKKHQYRGYIHIKIIPGSSNAAIEEVVSLASAVSLNVETPHAAAFKKLSARKNYDRDIVAPIKYISNLLSPGSKYHRVKQTTQFIVGAADETDGDIIQATFGLYRRLKLDRAYYSAYQRGLGDPAIPGESRRQANPADVLTREHRLYQAEWLMRKYGFAADEIPLSDGGFLSLAEDPKTAWARIHPERFPINVNRAEKMELLRVPGFGPTTVNRIISARQTGRIANIRQLGRFGKRLAVAEKFVRFD